MGRSHLLCELSVHVFLIGIIVFLFKIIVRIVYKNTNCTHLSHLFLYFQILWHMKCLIFIFHIVFSFVASSIPFVVVIKIFFFDIQWSLSNCQSPWFPSQPLLPHVLWETAYRLLLQTTPLGLGIILFLLRWDRFLSVMGWIMSPLLPSSSPNSSVKVLSPSASECDCFWRKDL